MAYAELGRTGRAGEKKKTREMRAIIIECQMEGTMKIIWILGIIMAGLNFVLGLYLDEVPKVNYLIAMLALDILSASNSCYYDKELKDIPELKGQQEIIGEKK